eukprot:1556106-Rhodomonas_salina.3
MRLRLRERGGQTRREMACGGSRRDVGAEFPRLGVSASRGHAGYHGPRRRHCLWRPRPRPSVHAGLNARERLPHILRAHDQRLTHRSDTTFESVTYLEAFREHVDLLLEAEHQLVLLRARDGVVLQGGAQLLRLRLRRHPALLRPQMLLLDLLGTCASDVRPRRA